MNRGPAITWGLFIALAVFMLLGVGSVPFHPDETSLLYQSRDLEALFTRPLSLAYEPSEPLDLAGEYRALNAPLSKYVLGAGRLAAGYGPSTVSIDWDWGRTWQENVQRGAMPPQGAMLGARVASTLVMLLGLVAVYFVGEAVDGKLVGGTAAVILGTNALALVHGRRAMAEGTLVLGIALALLGAIHARRRPWLVGLAAAVAFTAKHSALPISLVVLAASTGIFFKDVGGGIKRTAKAGASFLATVLLLNPFLWRAPISGAVTMVTSRQDLLRRQTSVTELLAPYGSLDTLSERVAALLGHLFILPPQFQEIGNYSAALQPTVETYMRVPIHNLMRGPFLGGIMLALFILGIIAAARSDRGLPGATIILGAATLFETAVLVAANSLPVQRYYVPLLPLVVLWQAIGVAAIIRTAHEELWRGSTG